MRQIAVVILVACAMSICAAGSALALFAGGSTEPKSDVPSRLIAKLRSDIDLERGSDRTRVPGIGLDEFDDLCSTFNAVSQRPLFNGTPAEARDPRFKNIICIDFEKGQDLQALAAEFNDLDCVEYAFPDAPVILYDSPDDALYPHQWSLNNTGQGYVRLALVAPEEDIQEAARRIGNLTF